MIINLNIHGSTAKFYRNFYNKPWLPNNLCAYFWKLFFAILFTPFVFPALLVNKILYPYYYFQHEDFKQYTRRGGEGMATGWGVVLNLIIIFAGCGITEALFGKPSIKYMTFWEVYANGFLAIAGVFFFFYFLVKIIRMLPKKAPKQYTPEEYDKIYWKEREKKEKRRAAWEKSFLYLCIQAFIAFKNKVCPLIEWQDEKKAS